MQLHNLAPLDQMQDLVSGFLAQQVYLAPILLLLVEEAGVPLPIADYIIMYTGYRVAQGYLPFALAFLLLLTADLIGASILYYLCSKFGPFIIERLGKYIHLDKHKLAVVEAKFRKHGAWFIIFGRHIPGMRVPITVFAGISEITYRTFIMSTFVSVVFWIPLYLYFGMQVGPQAMHLLHANGWASILFVLPLVFLIVPFLFLRSSPKKAQLAEPLEIDTPSAD